MEADRWQKLSRIYHAALALDASERTQYVADACAGDESLRNELLSLFAGEESGRRFLPGLVMEMAARMTAATASPRLTGRQIGRYHLLALIGSGGMGDVYRANDPKLGRDVAIKVLQMGMIDHSEHRARFEREARLLASLNHPNIAAIYGFEEADGIFALALELIDGPTLADMLSPDALPIAEALAIGRQIAGALEAAHEKGIVHRDLKPANIKVTTDGVVKVLDFGLAKALRSGASWDLSSMPTSDAATVPGAILGTLAYMSPEQARGRAVDRRTDIWAFGCVMYEMLTGRAPFAGETFSDTLAAILDREPDWRALPVGTPPNIVRLLQRCLEKDLQRRLRDAGDAGLEFIDPIALLPPTDTRVAAAAARSPISRRTVITLVGSVAAGAAASFFAGTRSVRVAPPNYQQLTFRRGSVLSARFAGSGNAIIYSAAWDGRSTELWSMRPDSPESRQLGLANADILSVSSSGEMAVLMGRRSASVSLSPGATLARLPLDASAPREVLTGVEDADWTPEGRSLAVAHVVLGKYRLEMPIGTVLYESEGWINRVRVSPDGEYVAFVDHPLYEDDRGVISVIARAGGAKRVLSPDWSSVTGLAWSPNREEIWFTAAELGATASLYAVDLSGRVRVAARSPNRMAIRDVDQDGRVLMTEGRFRLRIGAIDVTSRSETERDLSWLDGSVASDLSPDGTALLINEQGVGGRTPLYAVYIRRTDGSPAIRIGEGSSPALSSDGRWVASLLHRTPPSIALLPTGAGQPRSLQRGPLIAYQAVTWFPDGRGILFAGNETGRPVRLWTQEVPDGAPRPVSREGLRITSFGRPISPDGVHATALDPTGRVWLHSLRSDETSPIDGLEIGDIPIRWDSTGQSFYVFRDGQLPAVVYRFSIAKRRKEPIAMLTPADLAGVRTLASVQTTPDARLFIYSYAQHLSDLFLLSNLR